MKRLISFILAAVMTIFMCIPTLAMQLFVDIQDDEILNLEVESGDSVYNIKSKIYDAKGISPQLQHLYYNGKALQDDKTLADYNIQKESTVILEIKFTFNNTGDYNIGVDGKITIRPASEVISADISWETFDFTYTEGSQGSWNSSNHNYSGKTDGTWSNNTPGITVKNHSNMPITANFTFTPDNGVTTVGTFYDSNRTALDADSLKLSLASADGTKRDDTGTTDGSPTGTVYFGVSGDKINTDTSLGTVTVSIAKDTTV